MTDTPLHDWLRPRLDLMLAEGAAAGFEREAVLAVLTDLATGAAYNEVALPTEPELPHNQWPDLAEDTALYAQTDAPELAHGNWSPPHYKGHHDTVI